MNTGIVILAHGSRDPQWRGNVEAIAAQLTAQSGLTVACAYLELCSPTLDEVVADLQSKGLKHLRVLPLFFGIGKHASEDIPARLADINARFSQVSLELLPAAGDDARVRHAVVDMALDGLPLPLQPTA